ncbi:hypothetical protein Mgrana_00506 [Meiothermus granaticius NBRC 107808]|uniref:Uncharacterized protein n=1 Tax=Meiothermus granaticius NBRC 107808 TaxID=1227551 RepID=A0A399FBY2_9DEIN|nr:hypothetical protein Mgrana_00506 [Meiothermus granaticius NBRC 107808]
MGPVPPLAIKPLVYRLRSGEVDVQPDEVHQLEGTHRKPQALQDPVNGLFRDPLSVQPQGLAIERPGHPVDQETGGIAHRHRLFTPGLHQPQGLFHPLGRRLQPRNHLYQLHALRGVEEVQPQQARGVRDLGRDSGDRKGRGVGGQEVGGVQLGQPTQEFLLELQHLRHGLDHPVGLGTLGGVCDRLNPL